MRALQWIIITLCAIIITLLVLNRCESGPAQTETTKIDTLYLPSDDRWHELVHDKPVPYRVDSFIPIPANVDTQAILMDYFRKREYLDTVRNDSIDIFIREIISQNMILDRQLGYKWKAPQMVIRETKTFLAPAQIGVGLEPFIGNKQAGLFVKALYRKQNNNFTAGFDAINKTYQAGYIRTFNLPKRKSNK